MEESSPPVSENPLLYDSDTETVEVPIEYMRNALWYYENYYIQVDLIEQYEQEFEIFTKTISDVAKDVGSLERSKQFYKYGFIALIGYAVIRSAVDIVTAFIP